MSDAAETSWTARRAGRVATRLLFATALALGGLAPAAPGGAGQARAQEEGPRVVTTLPTYAAIAREITGDGGTVRAIARGDVDPHFVNPRPSFVAAIQRADLFVVTGLDLELWVPGLLDRASNSAVVEGAPGHVPVYEGIALLQVPENVSRAGGDIHVFGNPHVHTDPVNAIVIARNILAGLKRVAPSRAARYEAAERDFERRVMRRLFGEELVEMVGREALFELAREHRFWSFAEGRSYRGKPLTEYVGGWLAEAAPFRGKRMVCYHKNWAYFSARFRVDCAAYIEPKPGIPPSPGHVREVTKFIRDEGIRVLLAANYYSREQVERVASRTGARAVIVPEHTEGAEGVDTYFDLVDHWVRELRRAFAGESADARSGAGPRPGTAERGGVPGEGR